MKILCDALTWLCHTSVPAQHQHAKIWELELAMKVLHVFPSTSSSDFDMIIRLEDGVAHNYIIKSTMTNKVFWSDARKCVELQSKLACGECVTVLVCLYHVDNCGADDDFTRILDSIWTLQYTPEVHATLWDGLTSAMMSGVPLDGVKKLQTGFMSLHPKSTGSVQCSFNIQHMAKLHPSMITTETVDDYCLSHGVELTRVVTTKKRSCCGFAKTKTL